MSALQGSARDEAFAGHVANLLRGQTVSSTQWALQTVATVCPSALGCLGRSCAGLRHVTGRVCNWSRKDDTVVVPFVLAHSFLLHPFAMSMIKCAHASNCRTATHHNMVLDPCVLCMSYVTEAPPQCP